MATRNRQREIDQDILDTIVGLFTEGKRAAEIGRQLAQMPAFEGRELPHQRTLQRLVKDIRGNVTKATDSEKLLDQPFEWHRLEDYGLPWEASAYLLEMWMCVQAGLFFSSFPPAPPPTARQVRWWWRVHQVDTNIPMNDVWWIAQEFVLREVRREMLAQPLQLADLEAWVAFKPWVSTERRNNYYFAVQEGLIPPLSGQEQSVVVWDDIRKNDGALRMLWSMCMLPGPPELLPSQRWEWMERNQKEEDHER